MPDREFSSGFTAKTSLADDDQILGVTSAGEGRALPGAAFRTFNGTMTSTLGLIALSTPWLAFTADLNDGAVPGAGGRPAYVGIDANWNRVNIGSQFPHPMVRLSTESDPFFEITPDTQLNPGGEPGSRGARLLLYDTVGGRSKSIGFEHVPGHQGGYLLAADAAAVSIDWAGGTVGQDLFLTFLGTNRNHLKSNAAWVHESLTGRFEWETGAGGRISFVGFQAASPSGATIAFNNFDQSPAQADPVASFSSTLGATKVAAFGLFDGTAYTDNAWFTGAGYLTLPGDPTNALHAATKQYVDNINNGRVPKDSVRLATAVALPANTRTGNVLTASANGALTVDGVATALGDRILVKDETAQANCGGYTVTQLGTGGAPWKLTRSTDMDSWAELPGANMWVEEGTANADKAYVCTANKGGTLNTTAITFTQFGGTGAYQQASSVLTTYASIAPSANIQSLLGAADYTAARALLGVTTAASPAFTGVGTISGATTTAPSLGAQVTGDSVPRVRIGLTSADAPYLGFGPGSGAQDLFLNRDGANSLAQRNGTSGQAWYLYNTYTDAANFERFAISWNIVANWVRIGTNALGTGSARNIYFGAALLGISGTTNAFPALKRVATALQIRLADDSDYADLAARKITLNGPLQLKDFTVATLPAVPADGDRYRVTDANAPAWGATVAGGGTRKVPVSYDSTLSAWIVS